MTIIQFIGVFLAGIFAGIEFLVRYGVHPSLARLGERAGIEARQALVRRLRVVVPAVMLPTVAINTVAAVLDPGTVVRWVGIGSLVAVLLFSFLGTVPINIAVNDWDAAVPPSDWRAVVHRWEVIDVFRSSTAILGFALVLAALVV